MQQKTRLIQSICSDALNFKVFVTLAENLCTGSGEKVIDVKNVRQSDKLQKATNEFEQ